MDMTKIVLELQQTVLELQIEVAKLKQKCDNLSEEITQLKDNGPGTGIYLDGVPEFYRTELQRELDKEKR